MLGRLSGIVNPRAKAQLILELSRGWVSWAEEIALQRREALLKAAVNRATSLRPLMPSKCLASIRAIEGQGRFGAGGLRSDVPSLAAAPFVGGG